MDATSPAREGRLQVCLVAFFCLLYVLTANGRLVNRDAESVFQVARSIVEHGGFAVPGASVFTESTGPRGTGGDSLSFATETARIGVDGRPYSMYGLGESLAAVPFYVVGRAAQPLVRVDPFVFSRLAASLLNSFVTALTVLLLYRFGRMLGYSVKTAFLVAFAYGVMTMAWPYAKSFASEPLTGALLLSGFYALERAVAGCDRDQGRWLALSGTAYALALLVRVSAGVVLPVTGAYLLWRIAVLRQARTLRSPWTGLARPILLWSAPVLVALLVLGLYNMARFGDPWTTGYQSIAWNMSPGVGLYGLLLSPGKGILWYNPPLMVSIVGLAAMLWRRRPEALFIVVLSAVWIGFHSPYRFWEGGWSWGPRLLLPILPFLLLPLGALFSPVMGRAAVAPPAPRGVRTGARNRLARFVLALLLVASALIQITAVGADYTRYLWANSLEHPDEAYQRAVYDPTGSPLLWQPVALMEVIGNVARAGGLQQLRADESERMRQHQRSGLDADALSVAVLDDTMVVGLNVPDFWFILLPIFGADPVAVGVVAGLLALALAASAIILVRQLRARSDRETTVRRVAA